MSDIKSDFREWLQKNFSKSTASSYYGLVQKIFNKNFGDNQDWQKYSQSIMPLLVRYFEFANREYYLDRITIWYALHYFDEIAQFIYPKRGKTYKNEPDVKISLCDGKKDYPLCETSFYQLSNCLKYISCLIYQNEIEYDIDEDKTLKILMPIPQIEKEIQPLELKDIAIHVDYKGATDTSEKTALSRYCDFLYALTTDSTFDYKNNPVVNMTLTSNPNNMIGGNYYISQPITGKQPLQIKIKDKAREYLHDCIDDEDVDDSKEYIPDFILIVSDMVDILHIDRKSVVKHFVNKRIIQNMQPDAKKIEERYQIAKDKTVLRDYFSLSSTNEFLKDSHHSIYNKSRPVNYDKEGYGYWISQSEAVKELAVSRNAFNNLVTKNNCSYIDYIRDYLRYYDEDIQYLKTTRLIIEAQRRKRVYLRKNNKIIIN